MRSSVTQARVQILRKLVREIKKLQAKKGTAEQKEKNCRKADRFGQEVFFIKKLEPDDISKYALLCTESISEKLNKVSLPVEERAKVRLAAHKSVAIQVEIFRAKYPEWVLKLPPLMVQLGLKNRYKKKLSTDQSENITDTLSMKELTRNSEEENKLCESVDKDIEKKPRINTNFTDNISTTTSSHNEDMKANKETSMLSNKSERKIKGVVEVCKFADLLEFDNSSESSEHASSFEDDEEANKQTKILSNKCERKKNSIAEVRKFSDMLESDKKSENSGNGSPSSENEEPNTTNIVSDPFFLTGDSGDSEKHLDSSSEEEDRIKGSSNNCNLNFTKNSDKTLGRANIRARNKDWKFGQHHSKNDQKVPTMNRKQRRRMERIKAEMKSNSSSFQAGNCGPKNFEFPAKKKHGHKQEQSDFNKGSAGEEKEILHPSWEAKRKQREQQILPFQGKKIKFDDNDE